MDWFERAVVLVVCSCILALVYDQLITLGGQNIIRLMFESL